MNGLSRAVLLAGAAIPVFAVGAANAAPRGRTAGSAVQTTKPLPKVAPAPPWPIRSAPAWSVAFSPDGARLAVGGYRRVTFYDTQSGQKQAQWPIQSDAVRSLAFSANGKFLAAGTGIPAKTGGVIIFEAGSGKPARVVAGHQDAVEAVAFAGNLILSAGADEKVRVTNVATGQTVGVLGEHVGRCLSVAVPTTTSDADGGDIFVTGGADNVVKVWDAQTRRVVVNFDQCQSPVWSLAFFPRAGRFAAASGDGKLRVFGVRADADAKQEDAQRSGYVARTWDAHQGIAYAVVASPDGKWIVSGGADKRLVVWKPEGDKVREMNEATDDIFGVAVSPDGRLVAAASFDGKTRVYTLADGKLLWELPGPPPVSSTSTANNPTSK